MEIYYESGGKATATLKHTADSTIVHVEDISYTTTQMIPFATFRSMWVADGNADVDHVQTDSNTWHIQHGWQTIEGLSFKFLRSSVSKHNTLSPDILIAVESNSGETKHTIRPTSSTGRWTLAIIAISVIFPCCILWSTALLFAMIVLHKPGPDWIVSHTNLLCTVIKQEQFSLYYCKKLYWRYVGRYLDYQLFISQALTV